MKISMQCCIFIIIHLVFVAHEEHIVLSNGKEATIGYYDGNKNWSDISFYSINQNIAVLNYNLMNDDANEVIEFIKTINII